MDACHHGNNLVTMITWLSLSTKYKLKLTNLNLIVIKRKCIKKKQHKQTRIHKTSNKIAEEKIKMSNIYKILGERNKNMF